MERKLKGEDLDVFRRADEERQQADHHFSEENWGAITPLTSPGELEDWEPLEEETIGEGRLACRIEAALWGKPVDNSGDASAPRLVRAGGADPGNTASDTSQQPSGGVDTLEVAIYGDWSRSFEALASMLDERQKLARDDQPAALAVGDTWAQVATNGKRMGGVFFRWCLTIDGCRLYIVNRKTLSKLPSVYVVCGSSALMCWGHKVVWERVQYFLRCLGFTPQKNIVSRVDLALDVAGLDVGELSAAYSSGAVVTRGRLGAVYTDNRKNTGLSHGGGSVMVRAYDKIREIVRRPTRENVVKFEILKRQRYGGERPENATRVEFQVRRDTLRETFAVGSVEQVFDNLPRIASWCCSEWFRLTERPVSSSERTRNNQSRIGTHETWKRISEAFKNCFGEVVAFAPVHQQLKPVASRLAKQAVGVIRSMLALLPDCDNAEKTAAAVLQFLRDNAALAFDPQKIRDRRREFAARDGCVFSFG